MPKNLNRGVEKAAGQERAARVARVGPEPVRVQAPDVAAAIEAARVVRAPGAAGQVGWLARAQAVPAARARAVQVAPRAGWRAPAAASGAGGVGGAGGSNTGGVSGAGGAGGLSKGGASGTGGSSGGGASGTGGAGGSSKGGASGSGGVGGAGGTGTDAGGTGGSGGTSTTFHFAAYGDTRSYPGTHQQVIDGIAKLNPQLVIQSGDLWDGYTADQFRTILTKHSNLAGLLNSGKFVVSRGNHESLSEYLAFTPSLSRGSKTETFSYVEGNSFFVVLGMNPAGKDAFLDGELQKPEAQAARWKFVYSHYPIYSGGEHGASGNPAIEGICDKHQVAVYFSGHDHIYERTFQMKSSAPADQDDDLRLGAGTVYIVSGGGGAPLYTSSKKSWTRSNASTNHYIDVIASDGQLTLKALKLDGSQLDAFTITR